MIAMKPEIKTMNKIEEVLQKHTGCKGTCECGCGLVEAMKEFGKLAFEAGRRYHRTFYQDGYDQYKHDTYEDYLKKLYNEEENK
jgi:hypothetical protein